MSDQPDNEDSKIRLDQWKVGEIQLSGDIPPPSAELDAWLAKLLRNDRSAPKVFGNYHIRSYWTDSTGKVLNLTLVRREPKVQGSQN